VERSQIMQRFNWMMTALLLIAVPPVSRAADAG
jgi:hypothetical protein